MVSHLSAKKILLPLAVAALLLLGSACATKTSAPTPPPARPYGYTRRLEIGNQLLKVEVADTQEKMESGLSGRPTMAEDEGMLFDFGENKTSGAFWMKNMKFNLDIIWIDKNKIVGITPDVPKPDVNCKSLVSARGGSASGGNCLPYYYPPSPANWVLEASAGWAEKNNIKIGDKVEFN